MVTLNACDAPVGGTGVDGAAGAGVGSGVFAGTGECVGVGVCRGVFTEVVVGFAVGFGVLVGTGAAVNVGLGTGLADGVDVGAGSSEHADSTIAKSNVPSMAIDMSFGILVPSMPADHVPAQLRVFHPCANYVVRRGRIRTLPWR